MATNKREKQNGSYTVFGRETSFTGVLRFKNPLHIKGSFSGTIEKSGVLIVEKGAVVSTDRMEVTSLSAAGTVKGTIIAIDSVDMLSGSNVHGDVYAARLRIADNVLFEGQCSMTGLEDEMDIFMKSTDEIKATLLGVRPRP